MAGRFTRYLLLLLLPAGITFTSCKKGVESHPAWETNMLAPLMQASLTIGDLLADSLMQLNDDHSISLVFSDSLYHFSFADATLEIPDTTIKAGFSLQNLNLANQTIVYPLTLGQMCQQLGLLGQFIIAANGGVFPIPAIENITTGDNDIDATQFFETADLESGAIDMMLENGLPITISNIVFQVRNKMDQQLLTQDTFLNLLPGQLQAKVIDLAGKHVEGTLVASIIDLDSPGGVAPIDTSDALTITMVAHDLVVSSATAIFPAQNLIDENKETAYNLSGGALLNQLKVRSGMLIIKLQSTIQQQSHFEFALPSATDAFGNTIYLDEDLPPAMQGTASNLVKSFDLSGFTFNLTGVNGDTYNTYYTHLVASIDSTGELVTISKNDSVLISYTLQDIVPEFVSGYLGQQIVTIGPSETLFDGLKNIKSGSIGLESAAVDLSVKNGIGVSGRVNLYELTSINSNTGKNVSLQWDELNKPLAVAAASFSPFLPSVTVFSLNNANSNVKALLENLPDKFKYAMDFFVNPSGNSSFFHDFAFDTSGLDVGLNLTIPLSLIADKLVLQDTFDFALGSSEEGDPAIKEGTFSLIAYNGFPFMATPQLYFLDEAFNVVDSLFTSQAEIIAGTLNDQCLVQSSAKSVLTIPVDESKMNRMRAAKSVVVKTSFTTTTSSSCSTYLKIYDDYRLDIKLTGSFIFYTGY